MEGKKKKRKNWIRNSMSANIIISIASLQALFGVVTAFIGLWSFTNAFKVEYAESTYHMADTASMLVNADNLEAYLNGELPEEYERTYSILERYCLKIHVSIVYVIRVDQSDYGRFTSVFNCVNNAVDNTNYTPWELGFKRDTTNDEYRRKYKAIYEEGSPYETLYRIKTTDGQHPHVTTMVPVRNSNDEVVGILCMQRPARELAEARILYIRNVIISNIILAFIACCFAIWYFRRRIVKPIRKVSKEAIRFSREKTIGEGLENVSRFQVLDDLATSLDNMENDMVTYMDDLTRVAAMKQRIETEMSLAARIQEDMLPREYPAFTDRKDFEVFGSMNPAKEVGGDFFHHFLLDDTHLCLMIADVSGKGVPAALTMMAAMITLNNIAQTGKGPAEILAASNDAINAHNRSEMFITVWLGILDLTTGVLTAANAGHEYPTIYHEGGQFELVKDKHGLVIGAMDGLKYKEYTLELKPGSKLFVYTDGVPEATNRSEELFGTDRMLVALNEEPTAGPQKILANVRKHIDDFVGDAEQFDDLTMLCVEYRGPQNV